MRLVPEIRIGRIQAGMFQKVKSKRCADHEDLMISEPVRGGAIRDGMIHLNYCRYSGREVVTDKRV